jgi:hypothetical protein
LARGVLRLVMPRWLPQGVFVSRYFPRRQTVAGVVLKLAPETSQPARGPRMRQGRRPEALRAKTAPAGPHGPPMRQDRRRLCGALRAKTAPAASESPTQARKFYADETLMPGDRRGATKSPPVCCRSPLPAIDSPRLVITNYWLGSRPICGPSFTSSLLMVASSSSSVTLS